MKQVLTGFSQLSKDILRPVEAKVPQSRPERRDEGADALRFFGIADTGSGRPEAPNDASLRERIAQLEAVNRDLTLKLVDAERRCNCKDHDLDSAKRRIAQLEGDRGRLKGELEKANAKERGKGVAVSVPVVQIERSGKGILSSPAKDFAEVFPGEVREIVLAVLAEARDQAQQGGRERRAAVLNALLGTNASTGELARRREEIKRILKDNGFYTDPKALERLGFRLVSGRTHWKLEYADVRIPMAKTPSDYRAIQNMALDLSKRCL